MVVVQPYLRKRSIRNKKRESQPLQLVDGFKYHRKKKLTKNNAKKLIHEKYKKN